MASGLVSLATDGRLGTLNVEPRIEPPPLPPIVAEWAAVIPLVVHLASVRGDYITTGEVSLLGRICVGLYPRLGTLSSLARLLQSGPEFLDQSSTIGLSNRKVWDVRWGSVFPAANGATTAAIIKHVLGGAWNRKEIYMPANPGNPTDPAPAETQKKQVSATVAAVKHSTEKPPRQPSIVNRQFRRYQRLHVLHYERNAAANTSWFGPALDRLRFSTAYNLVLSALLIALAAGLVFFGAHGTAAVLFTSAISRTLCLRVRVERPPEYLLNNENHDACMLMASHENSVEWYLHIGDRSVVDTLLNKPMIDVTPRARHMLVANWFRVAHILQFAATSFAAAQKGWDGVCLVAVLAVDRGLNWHFRGRTLARNWLASENIQVEAKTFVFNGRGTLFGAIQVWSGSSVTSWMDEILVPHPRRNAWLRRLAGQDEGQDAEAVALDPADKEWVDRAAKLSFACAEVLKAELNTKTV